MPRSFAIALAVTTWSPVIITGLMPAAAFLDGFARFGAGRVDHADQTDQLKAAFEIFRSGFSGDFVDHLGGDRQHAQRAGTHFVVNAARRFEVAGNHAAAQHIERAFDDDEVLAVYAG